MDYKAEQKLTREKLAHAPLIKGYKLNSDQNRAQRRKRINKWEQRLTGMNTQTVSTATSPDREPSDLSEDAPKEGN